MLSTVKWKGFICRWYLNWPVASYAITTVSNQYRRMAAVCDFCGNDHCLHHEAITNDGGDADWNCRGDTQRCGYNGRSCNRVWQFNAWMVAMCMFMAAGFIKSGLGKRIAYLFVSLFGKRTLSLAYALSFVDAVLAIGIPSNNARVNGIMYPIIDNLSREMGSDPKQGTQRN
ncbi:Dicarboxylate transporter 1, chloroplastic [Lactiplantibacillus plantarum subsp. plantarum]|uniref:Dicarboxylate transporter 1, chloroplastic n=1 Tax=Lactiplantibacillus plantarum subsp. plantarum TaxID=337330 RepID=A0A2S3U9A1_LACPN|nr:Dicarboxylate transporter 1, chloroplastic [Lactiplantibacillus plantarum subsp. plantarum]